MPMTAFICEERGGNCCLCWGFVEISVAVLGLGLFPTSTRRLPNAGSMLARRLRRRSNIEPTLGKYPVFAGITTGS